VPCSHQVHPRRPLLAPVAIVVQQNVEGRRYSGWTDPRYPIGYWQGAGVVQGNLSGGSASVDLLFQQANGGAFRNTQLYSVERIMGHAAENATRTVRLSATNMGGPSNLGFINRYTLRIVDHNGITGAALEGNQFTLLPWFLGSQRTAGVTAAISMAFLNQDGILFTFEAEGYLWSPRSILVDGGPQRPPTGLYRA